MVVGKNVKAKHFLSTFLLFCLAVFAHRELHAQPTKKVIGWIGSRTADSAGTGRTIFRQELARMGYVEGKNISIEFRSAEGSLERLPGDANDLVRLNPDVLVASSPVAAVAAHKATRSIPIVGINLGDPIGLGLVQSLARPGGNVTGFTEIVTVLAGKRLEILRETIPKLFRVGLLWDPQNFGSGQWDESRVAAKEMGIQLHSMEVSMAEKYEPAFKEALKRNTGAIAVAASPVNSSNRTRIIKLAAQNRLPAIYSRADFAENGGLMSYGADRVEQYHRAAFMVDRILKGAKPTDLPVEQPTKFELVVNLKAAKEIDLTIPQRVLLKADRVIK